MSRRGPSWRRESQIDDKDELTEQAIAGWGDWQPKRDRIYQKSLKQLHSEWKFIDTITVKGIILDLYMMNTKPTFILGKVLGDSFETLFHIELSEQKSIGIAFGYKQLMNVDGVMTKDTMRGNGLAKFMYQYLVDKLYYTILGDEIQYHKARLIWASLSKLAGLVVDIIDIDADKIIEKDVELYHGEADHDFDERVWSYDTIKKHIRLVLTKVK